MTGPYDAKLNLDILPVLVTTMKAIFMLLHVFDDVSVSSTELDRSCRLTSFATFPIYSPKILEKHACWKHIAKLLSNAISSHESTSIS